MASTPTQRAARSALCSRSARIWSGYARRASPCLSRRRATRPAHPRRLPVKPPERAASPPTPADAIYTAVVALARALRSEGVASGPDAELALLRALAEVDLRRRQSVYWAARASLLHRPDEVEVFDRLFERFWEGFDLFGPVRGSEHGESDPRATGPHHGGEALPQYRVQGRESTLLGGRRSRDKQEVPSA